MRRVAILGSTGSIGRQALDVIASHPQRFEICGLAANANIASLAEQVRRFNPAVVSCGSEEGARELAARLAESAPSAAATRAPQWGQSGLRAVAAESDADIVIAATDGLVSCRAVFAAIELGIDVAVANKELIVAAGELLFDAARLSGARILPIDSEHSAVLQCLAGERREDVSSIVLTASGGPFWDLSPEELQTVTPAQALAHPTWVMGAKNTIDSATLMNKGLEVIEACRLFGALPAQVEVVVHRQSVAHAFVIFADGSVKSQLAAPDMRMPIGYALAFPDRLPEPTGLALTRRALGLDGTKSILSFEPVDHKRFPCVRLAYRTVELGGTFPAVLSAANEEAGRAFLQGKISFVDIGALVAGALEAHQRLEVNLPNIEEADRWARSFTRDAIATRTSLNVANGAADPKSAQSGRPTAKSGRAFADRKDPE